MLFFKNRDLEKRYLDNRVTVFHATLEFRALKGANLKTGELEGASIGVNRQQICVANTHIVSTDDVTYDVLCEKLLCEAQYQKDVPQVVQGFMAHNTVQGGRILVAAPGWAFLIEVWGRQFEIQTIEGNFAITNHFSLLPHSPERSAAREQSSLNRLQVANEMLPTISNIKSLKSMLRSHLPEKGDLSICNHRPDGGGTESSHILHIQGNYVSWSSLAGFPCENDYDTLQLFA
jgi:hypothetical protein